MKIEKLTENKIRVIIHSDEIELNDFNVHNIMIKAIETQDIFKNILKKAEKEVDFYTDGCKLLIEASSSLEDVLVFTITKFSIDTEIKKKKLIAKRKSFPKISKHSICQFETFDAFCEFCTNIKTLHKLDIHELAKNNTLYLWKNNYYLILKNINSKYENIDLFYSTLSEFGKLLSFSEYFDSKLSEHGKVMIKKDAIHVGINFFVK